MCDNECCLGRTPLDLDDRDVLDAGPLAVACVSHRELLEVEPPTQWED